MNENTGVVSWTRLYKSDDEKVKLITNKVKRTKAQIIRMLVHEGIKNNIIKEFEVIEPIRGKFGLDLLEEAQKLQEEETTWIP